MYYRNGKANIINVGRRHSAINTHHQAVCRRHKQWGQSRGVVGGMQESAWIGSSSPSILFTTSGFVGLAPRQRAVQERNRRRAGTAGLQRGGVVSMTFGSRLDYEKDYVGPRLWPKHPIDPNRDWNKCKEMVELGGGLKVSKVSFDSLTEQGSMRLVFNMHMHYYVVRLQTKGGPRRRRGNSSLLKMHSPSHFPLFFVASRAARYQTLVLHQKAMVTVLSLPCAAVLELATVTINASSTTESTVTFSKKAVGS